MGADLAGLQAAISPRLFEQWGAALRRHSASPASFSTRDVAQISRELFGCNRKQIFGLNEFLPQKCMTTPFDPCLRARRSASSSSSSSPPSSSANTAAATALRRSPRKLQPPQQKQAPPRVSPAVASPTEPCPPPPLAAAATLGGGRTTGAQRQEEPAVIAMLAHLTDPGWRQALQREVTKPCAVALAELALDALPCERR